MPQYGNITDPSRPILKEIDRIIKLGFDFIEISVEGPEGTPDYLLPVKNEIIGRIRSQGLFATGHIAWWAELASLYQGVRKAWLVETKKAIDTARVLQLQKVNVHSHVRGLYMQHQSARQQTIDQMIESLGNLLDYAEGQGVELMLENSASRRDIAKFEDFNRVVQALPNLGVHVDIAHAYLHGRLGHIDQYLRSFKNRLSHIHISDNFGKDDDHLPIGQGKINFERVVKTLKRIKYDGTITFEIFQKKKEGIPRSLTTFKRLWNRM